MREARALLALAALYVLPPVSYVALGLDSMTPGFMLACLIAIVLAGRVGIPVAVNGILFLFGAALLFRSLAELGLGLAARGPTRLVSVAAVIVMCLAASSMSAILRRLDDDGLRRVFDTMAAAIAVFAIMSLVPGPELLNYARFERAVFPFSEPSHFAGWSVAFVLVWLVRSRPLPRLIAIGAILALALLVESVFMVAIALGFYALVVIPLARPAFRVLNVVAIVGAVVLLRDLDLSYFASRLDFSENNVNLTSLVYLQGWEEMGLTLEATQGWGVGFQRLGTTDPGRYSELIFRILGEYKMRDEGGFLAVKLVGEFGYLGVTFIAGYLVLFARSALAILRDVRQQAGGAPARSPLLQQIGHVFVISFFFDLFARSVGYFSLGPLLLLVGVLVLHCPRMAWLSFARRDAAIVGRAVRDDERMSGARL